MAHRPRAAAYAVFSVLFVAYAAIYVSKCVRRGRALAGRPLNHMARSSSVRCPPPRRRSPAYWTPWWVAVADTGASAGAATLLAGALSSVHETWSGLSKIIAGLVVDLLSPTVVFTTSIGLVGMTHFLVAALPLLRPLGTAAPAALSSAAPVAVWGFNGFVQAFACVPECVSAGLRATE